MTQREMDQLRALVSALRDSALSVVQQATVALDMLPTEPPPPPKPADSLDGLSFAGE